ncbi:DUF4832 domain-containing protein [Pedobacter psychrophilus]|nr:DUF4832 domain-containing protein [Pedobacter psychrophilus]
MKQVLSFSIISSLAIILMSCQKDDLSTLNFKPISDISNQGLSVNSISDSSNVINVNPTENFGLLLNPGKGFVKYYDFDAQYASVFGTKYIRYDWADIQPKEGVYNWDWIDNEIAECRANGKKFAFGIMSANTNRSINTPDKGKYVTPKWVFDAGAAKRTINATYWETGQTVKQIIPIWTDAIFLTKLKNFITALGNRYNGNKDIAFIDVRSYGNWGEQHLYELGGTNLTSAQLKLQHLQVYKDAFPNTQLITPWGEHFYDDTYQWAVDNGIGMRSDGIFKYSNGSEVTRAHTKAPSIFEYTAAYGWLTSEGYWNPDTLLKYIEIGKPSYIQFDADMYNANTVLYTQVANRVGYHFVIKNVHVQKNIVNGQSFYIQTSILNKGVTNIYEDCYLALALINSNGEVVQKKFLTQSFPKNWKSDQLSTETNNIILTGLNQGTYTLALGMFSSMNDAEPKIAFANNSKTANNWFMITNQIQISLDN